MRRILVVDDDDQMKEMIQESLNIEGYKTSGASNGKEAMALLVKESFDMVITDIVMPEQEGIETIMQIRKGFPHIKIITISGGGRTGPVNYLRMAKEFGASRTFIKPFERKDLIDAVRELLSE